MDYGVDVIVWDIMFKLVVYVVVGDVKFMEVLLQVRVVILLNVGFNYIWF